MCTFCNKKCSAERHVEGESIFWVFVGIWREMVKQKQSMGLFRWLKSTNSSKWGWKLGEFLALQFHPPPSIFPSSISFSISVAFFLTLALILPSRSTSILLYAGIPSGCTAARSGSGELLLAPHHLKKKTCMCKRYNMEFVVWILKGWGLWNAP